MFSTHQKMYYLVFKLGGITKTFLNICMLLPITCLCWRKRNVNNGLFDWQCCHWLTSWLLVLILTVVSTNSFYIYLMLTFMILLTNAGRLEPSKVFCLLAISYNMQPRAQMSLLWLYSLPSHWKLKHITVTKSLPFNIKAIFVTFCGAHLSSLQKSEGIVLLWWWGSPGEMVHACMCRSLGGALSLF